MLPSVLRRLIGEARGLVRKKVDVRERRSAVDWCTKHAMPTAEAIRSLTGLRDVSTVSSLYPEAFGRASKVAAECPAKMGGAGNLDLLYHLSEYLEATRIVETGIAYGWSSLAILLSLAKRPTSQLISTDLPYSHFDATTYVGCVVPPQLHTNWTILRGPDRTMLPRALEMESRIDFCHYDSDKSRQGRNWAYPLLWRAVRAGGFFISDDIDDNLSFRRFCELRGVHPIVVSTPTSTGTKYVGVVKKQ